MNETIGTYFFLEKALAAAVVLLALIAGFCFGGAVQRLKSRQLIKKERDDAVKKSRAVLGGLFSEQLAPFLPGFPCNPGDVRFVGKPVDFIAFPGSAEGKDVEEIYFIEVKSGKSSLTPRERQIQAAVEQGRVRYIEYRL
ncbi:MAG: Holliday junction resolvase [Treponema sp.]|nr:Holliday junction resolvase [Treponema sp.]